MEKVKLCIDRESGEAYYQGESVLILQRSNPSCCLMGADCYLGRGSRMILYTASKNIARKRFYEMVHGQKGDGKDIMRKVLDHLSLCGYGIFEIKKSDKDMLIEVRNSFNAMKYSSDSPRCCMMAGTLAGVMELITGKEQTCIEEDCESKGDDVCSFWIRTNPSEKNAEPVKDWWKGKSPPERAEESFVEYDGSRGEVFSGGTNSIILSRQERCELQKELKKVMDPEWKTIMYECVGRISTMEAVPPIQKFMVRVMRIISKRKIVEKLLENYGERGTGIFSIIDFDEKRMTARISVKNSHFAAGYQKSKEPVCYAMAGCLAGGGEIVFRKNIACRETKCAAMGDDHCEFEVFPEYKKANG